MNRKSRGSRGRGGGGGEEGEEDEWKERGDAGNRRRPEIKREQPCQGRDGRIKREISNRSSCDSYFSRSMDDRESLPRKRSSNAIPRTRRGESKRLKTFCLRSESIRYSTIACAIRLLNVRNIPFRASFRFESSMKAEEKISELYLVFSYFPLLLLLLLFHSL